MRRIVWAGVLALAVLITGLASAEDARGPKIEVREVKYDFGKVVQGTEVSHVFVVRNAGTEQLIIERVQPS